MGLLCRKGHVHLANGDDASDVLERALALQRELGVGPESGSAKGIVGLERAQAAFRGGAHLVCGYCLEDLTAGQLRWLREHRPEAIPAVMMARLNEDGTPRTERA